MNKLARAGENRWHLPQHAHIIVYEAEQGDQLLTIYDCGAAQKPPSAKIIGNLVRVRPEHELNHTVTGYVVRMRERSVLEKQDGDHFVVVPV
ncbi:hypothetical protein [Haladaptatus sp. NG-WS-4]